MQDWYRDGIPVWWDESDRVTFDAEPRTSKSRAAVDRAQEKASKGKSNPHGRYYVAKPTTIDGGPMPTREEWLEEQSRKAKTNKPVTTKFGTGNDRNRVQQGRK